MGTTFSYLDLLTSRDLNSFMRSGLSEIFPGIASVNPAYSEKLVRMQRSVAAYMKDETLRRPFLYLILGSPGAGKSHLINSLSESLQRAARRKIKFQAANLSEMVHPEELHGVFNRIVQNTAEGVFTITFLDEFDVKLGGGSAIKYLINPIYDGKFWDGNQFHQLGHCAFFFAGSYLLDRQTLIQVRRSISGIDLHKFLLAFYLKMHSQDNHDAMEQIRSSQEFCDTHQRWGSAVDPRTDTIAYLTNLEKIRDFLSRLGGNFLEMPDLSWPLGITEEPYALDGQAVRPSKMAKLSDLVSFVLIREANENSFLNYQSSYAPLAEYKNVILCERLARVLQIIFSRFGQFLRKRKRKCVEIDRRLLNFLTLVPLHNGMRSLEQLVNLLELPVKGRIRFRQFQPEETDMIIQNSLTFGDPYQVWEVLKDNNPTMKKLLREVESLGRCFIKVPLPAEGRPKPAKRSKRFVRKRLV